MEIYLVDPCRIDISSLHGEIRRNEKIRVSLTDGALVVPYIRAPGDDFPPMMKVPEASHEQVMAAIKRMEEAR